LLPSAPYTLKHTQLKPSATFFEQDTENLPTTTSMLSTTLLLHKSQFCLLYC